MRAFLFVVALVLAVGLIVAVDRSSTRARPAAAAETTESAASIRHIESRKPASSIASYPDRGQLFASDHVRQMVRSGASTWHPVRVSEEHALRAIAEGGMTVPGPNGETILLRYERHLEHPDGNWTWVGREDGSAPGTETVLTFGEKAVFGTIRHGNADLRLTTEAGSTWLVVTDYSRIDRDRVAATDDDFVVPAGMPKPKAVSGSGPIHAAVGSAVIPVSAEESTQVTSVDIAMGYTTGFATRLGGESQALTRLNFLVDTTNQAYLASGINAQIRLAHALQVDYPDATHNRTALFDLTGVDCTTQTNGTQYLSDRRVNCTPITQSSGLQPLTAARETYGADLVVLVRKFEAPEQASCGSAWMLGGGQNPIDANSAAFGMALVSDSSADMFPDEGSTCPEVMLAHELGHNMGQQHDVVTARGSDDSDNNGNLLDPEEFGHHSYSFGYSTDDTGSDIATIMSNRRLSQTRYRVFSNPLITTCGGAPCGIADLADNVRSMAQTMPIIAMFRATASAANLDLYAIGKIGDAGATEVHVLSALTSYQSFLLHASSSIGATGADYAWRYQLGDYNADGALDLFGIFRTGASGRTEVHVVDGAGGFQTFLLHSASALLQTGSDNSWLFRLGDYNGDGRPDLYAIARNGASGWSELHVLNGADNFGTFLAHIILPLPPSGNDGSLDFMLGDQNADGVLDLYLVLKANTGSGRTEVHVMNGATNFTTFTLHSATALAPTGTDNAWVFKLGDYNGDAAPDLFAIGKAGASGRTEIHVLDGADGFQTFRAHIATALGATGVDNSWEFELGNFQ